jgi:hypothetical protein
VPILKSDLRAGVIISEFVHGQTSLLNIEAQLAGIFLCNGDIYPCFHRPFY